MLPVIGASGGISGIVVLYALRFPRARLGLAFAARLQVHLVNIPTWFAALVWLIAQAIGAALIGYGSSGGVAYLAHLGGAAVGATYWLLDRSSSRPLAVA
jgi:membrane associated rhomboid family serine protease